MDLDIDLVNRLRGEYITVCVQFKYYHFILNLPCNNMKNFRSLSKNSANYFSKSCNKHFTASHTIVFLQFAFLVH